MNSNPQSTSATTVAVVMSRWDWAISSTSSTGSPVIPTLTPGTSPRVIAAIFAELMTKLGYQRFLIQGANWAAPGPAGWFAVIVLAVVSTYIARLSYFAAMGRLGGAQVALLGPLETLLSVTWSILFLHERLAPAQFIGGGLILFSALLAVQRLGRVNLLLPRR